ncbi:MAG: porin family protein [Gammaproteobacteria bacterium]|nr:porin family protein [Gammaproteobacteria bacterium]
MTATKKIGLIALVASLSWGAQAANFDYNYGQVGYETGDYDGLTLTGSFEVNEELFVLARYTGLSNDDTGVDIDFTEISIGAGYHMAIDEKTDAVFTVSLNSAEVDSSFQTGPGSTVDDTGILLTAGVRHNLNANVELAGGIYHNSAFDGDTGFQGEARYNINNEMSAGLSFTSGDFVDGLGVNFRMGF